MARWPIPSSASLLLAAGPPAPNLPAALAGRYAIVHPVRPHDGLATAETIVEIVPVAADAAYVRIHYENGGICGFAEVAAVAGRRLVYRAPAGDPPCTLAIAHESGRLAIEGASCSAYCGASVALSDATMPFARRRPITYLARLKASSHYRAALAAWRR